MKLELGEALSFILAIPAHRSHNEGHRKMGEKALDLVIEYKDLGADETETAFNRAMIAAVLSAVRAFSVERDRIGDQWKAIEAIKQRRERLLEVVRNLSPLSKGNYWAKALVIIISLGFMPSTLLNFQQDIPISNILLFVLVLIIFEVISKGLEYFVSCYFEKNKPMQRTKKWQTESIEQYKKIASQFIDEGIQIYKRYYPDTKNLYEYNITEEDAVKMKEHLLNLHFYLDNK